MKLHQNTLIEVFQWISKTENVLFLLNAKQASHIRALMHFLRELNANVILLAILNLREQLNSTDRETR